MTKQGWYEKHNCTHAHCPYECEHPQPVIYKGELICQKCYYDTDKTLFTKMVPCTPETCID